jgi:hypothetical protein
MGNFELLCLENPLLDIQGQGYNSETFHELAYIHTKMIAEMTRCFRNTASSPMMPY